MYRKTVFGLLKMPIFTKFAQDNIVAYAVAALGFGGRVAAVHWIYNNMLRWVIPGKLLNTGGENTC